MIGKKTMNGERAGSNTCVSASDANDDIIAVFKNASLCDDTAHTCGNACAWTPAPVRELARFLTRLRLCLTLTSGGCTSACESGLV